MKYVLLATIMLASISQAADHELSQLMHLSIEELAEVDVVSVSRKPESWAKSPAAVYVITSDDIRRSGAQTIPDLLRLVPGMQVARIQSAQWAITSRGFNSRTANKLQVLIDGRTVYSPFFTGVQWDMHDLLLEDIDRIEVIRGPGASVWGANAVNGVINIITKSSRETLGGYAGGGGGTEMRRAGEMRYGGEATVDFTYRGYLKFVDYGHSVNSDGEAQPDEWSTVRGGWRSDWQVSPEDNFTFQWSAYQGTIHQLANVPIITTPFFMEYNTEGSISGWHLLAKWDRELGGDSMLETQLYYDRSERDDGLWIEERNFYNFDLVHRFRPLARHEIVWGFESRLTRDRVADSPAAQLDPNRAEYRLFGLFVEDDITVVKERLRMSLGTKFEHNNYTGIETQPSARFLWTPGDRNVFWGAVSRAVRLPSRVERDTEVLIATFPAHTPVFNPYDLPAKNVVYGNDDYGSEKLTALDGGYRFVASDRFSIDIATYYNWYTDLRTADVDTTPTLMTDGSTAYNKFQLPLVNKMEGESYGVEIAGEWMIVTGLRLRGTYSYLSLTTRRKLESSDIIPPGGESHDPNHQATATVSVDPLPGVELDGTLRYVGPIDELGVDRYLTADLRLGVRLHEMVDLRVVGRNLLHSQHTEFYSGIESLTKASTDVQRSIFVGLTWRFEQ